MIQRGQKRRRQIFILRGSETLPVLNLRWSNFKGGGAKVALSFHSAYGPYVKI